ncbi:MAG: hypothetical protein AAFV93_01950 [Chloroflexota bacterium]
MPQSKFIVFDHESLWCKFYYKDSQVIASCQPDSVDPVTLVTIQVKRLGQLHTRQYLVLSPLAFIRKHKALSQGVYDQLATTKGSD